MDADDSSSVARMYTIYEVLNNAEDKALAEDEYRELLTCVKKSDKEKRLASPFISRFIEFFPLLIDNSINALFDLCEDDDISVRKQVFKDLVTVCGKFHSQIPKISDVFAQVLANCEIAEVAIIHSSLERLFKIDAEATLRGLFVQIKTYGNEDIHFIEPCLSFLATKFKKMDTVTVIEEKVLLNELKEVANFICQDDFSKMMEIISATKVFDTKGGRAIVLDIILKVLNPEKNFDGTLEENIHKFTKCGEEIAKISALGENCTSSFVIYCCTKVIPNLRDCLCHEDGGVMQFDILKVVAEASVYLKTISKEDATKCLEAIYKYVLDQLPLPNGDETVVHNYKYSIIECYLFVLYKLCSKTPEFLSGNKEKLLDFRTRLQAYARVVKAYINALEADISGKDQKILMSKEVEEKNFALKLAKNIYVIIKDFFRTPIQCSLQFGLSWLPASLAEGNKRRLQSDSRLSNEPERKLKKPDKVGESSRKSIEAPPKEDLQRRRVISPDRRGYDHNNRHIRKYPHRYHQPYSNRRGN